MLIFILLFSQVANGAESVEFVDPMRPLNYRAEVAPSNEMANERQKTATWELNAVLLSPKRSVAVINGKSLQQGEKLEGYTLMSIQKNRVVLNGKGRKLVLQRSGTGLKKKSDNRK